MFIPIPLIDRVGRRPLMLFAAVGQCLSIAVLASCIAYPDSKLASYVAAVFLFVFNTFIAIGFCGIPFLLPVELTPLQTRGKSVAIATGIFWLCNFFVVMISPILINNSQYKLTSCGCPETSKATLEDVDILFEENPTWWIGPGSRKKLAQIVADREVHEEAERVVVGER
ncbi:hypothetical protein GQ53DRAFT_831556 [Thozetella sp. PMI_491]|nr:hypothetical protein GQ53DRAFT_831556 [Thozetella sp. PMI_491]